MLSYDKIYKIAQSGFHIMVRTGFATSVETINCYPEDWVNLYTKEGFMLHDPILRWAYENTGSNRWSDLSGDDPKGILDIASDFGLKYGLVISRSSSNGVHRRTIASFAKPDREFDPIEVDFLNIYVEKAHDKSSALLSVTDKEIEVLKMLMNGMMIKEIAAHLGVSQSAVKQRLTNSKNKLDAKTTAQAVAMLTQHNLI